MSARSVPLTLPSKSRSAGQSSLHALAQRFRAVSTQAWSQRFSQQEGRISHTSAQQTGSLQKGLCCGRPRSPASFARIPAALAAAEEEGGLDAGGVPADLAAEGFDGAGRCTAGRVVAVGGRVRNEAALGRFGPTARGEGGDCAQLDEVLAGLARLVPCPEGDRLAHEGRSDHVERIVGEGEDRITTFGDRSGLRSADRDQDRARSLDGEVASGRLVSDS